MRMASISSRAGYFCSFTTSHFEISRPPFEDTTSGIRRASAPASRSALNTRPYPPYFRVSHSRTAIRRGVFILNSVKNYCLSGDSFKQFRYGCDIGKNTSLLRLDFAASFPNGKRLGFCFPQDFHCFLRQAGANTLFGQSSNKIQV